MTKNGGGEPRPIRRGRLLAVLRSGQAIDLSVPAVFRAIAKHFFLIGAITVGAVATVVAMNLMQPRLFTSHSSFVPQARSMRSQAADLAAQFGLGVAGDASDSPEFYTVLLSTRAVLEKVVTTRYQFNVGSRSMAGTLPELYDLPPGRDGVRAAVDILKGASAAKADPLTGLVRVTVSARWAPLAEQLAVRMLDLTNEFNLETRQSQASAERAFIEERLRMAQSELRSTEQNLEQFLRQNREFRNSPELLFRHQRLEREVGLRQSLVAGMAQSYEQARVAQVRNTPVITIVERPDGSALPQSRHTLVEALVAMIVGFAIGVALALAIELWRWNRATDSPAMQAAGPVAAAI